MATKHSVSKRSRTVKPLSATILLTSTKWYDPKPKQHRRKDDVRQEKHAGRCGAKIHMVKTTGAYAGTASRVNHTLIAEDLNRSLESQKVNPTHR